VNIVDADIRDIGSVGIKVAVPRGTITGTIYRTNQSGVDVTALGGATGDKLRIAVTIEEAGQLEAGDIGASMIPKTFPSGVSIRSNVAWLDLTGTSIIRSRESGILFLPQAGGVLKNVVGTGLVFREIAETLAGAYNGTGEASCIRRSSSGTGTISDIRLEGVVQNCKAPLVGIENASETDDERIDIALKVSDLTLDVLVSPHAITRFIRPGSTAAGRITDVTLDLDLKRCTYTTLKSVPAPNDAAEIKVRLTTEADFAS
jgi:hypothetical protein